MTFLYVAQVPWYSRSGNEPTEAELGAMAMLVEPEVAHVTFGVADEPLETHFDAGEYVNVPDVEAYDLFGVQSVKDADADFAEHAAPRRCEFTGELFDRD